MIFFLQGKCPSHVNCVCVFFYLDVQLISSFSDFSDNIFGDQLKLSVDFLKSQIRV